MSSSESHNSNIKYWYVVGGKLRSRVTEDYPGALERVNKNGVTVYEEEKDALFGLIEDLKISEKEWDGKKMKNLEITLDADEDNRTPVLSLSLDSREGANAMRFLPNVDLSKDVRFYPYRFTPKGEAKEKAGMSIHQRDAEGKFAVKIEDAFWDGKNKLNGAPSLNYNESSESEKKIYWIQLAEFLETYLRENVIPKVQKPVLSGETASTGNSTYSIPENTTTGPANNFEYPTDEINPEDVGF